MTGAIGLVGCSLMRARLPPTKRKGGILSAFDFHRFKDFTFVRVYCMCIISGLGFFSVWIFLSTFGGSIGISPENAALIVGLGNGMAAIGRVVSGATSDKLGAMNMWLLNFFVAALAVLLIWTNASNFGLLLFFSLVFGWAGGSYTSLYALNMAHLYGSAGQAALLGLLYTALIPGSLLGAPIGKRQRQLGLHLAPKRLSWPLRMTCGAGTGTLVFLGSLNKRARIAD
jgi:predicted MFS family arabinose efflux permease